MPVRQPALPHPREDVEIEEVHEAQHQQDHADLRAQTFQTLLRSRRRHAILQRERHITDVDQIEPDDEQVIDRVRKLLVSQKTIHEEDTTVCMQRPGDPDGERNADGEVDEIGRDNPVHIQFPFFVSVFSVLTEIQ